MDKTESSDLLHQIIREELQQILKELNSKETYDTVLNRKETCKLLSIFHGTLQKYQNEGRIPHYRIGRRVLFKKSDVLKAIEVKMTFERKRQTVIKYFIKYL